MNKNTTTIFWRIYFWLIFGLNLHFFVTKQHRATLEDVIMEILSLFLTIPSILGLAGFVFNKNFLHKIFWKFFTPLFILIYLSAMIVIYFSHKGGPPPLGGYLLICLGASLSFFPLFYALIHYSYLRK